MKIQIYPETCCELCNDVIHNHIDCPACGKRYASTDAYYDIWDDIWWAREDGIQKDIVIECQSCRASFKYLSCPEDGIWSEDSEWEQLGKKQ